MQVIKKSLAFFVRSWCIFLHLLLPFEEDHNEGRYKIIEWRTNYVFFFFVLNFRFFFFFFFFFLSEIFFPRRSESSLRPRDVEELHSGHFKLKFLFFHQLLLPQHPTILCLDNFPFYSRFFFLFPFFFFFRSFFFVALPIKDRKDNSGDRQTEENTLNYIETAICTTRLYPTIVAQMTCDHQVWDGR